MLRSLVLIALGVSALALAQQEPSPARSEEVAAMRGFPDPAAPARVGVGITQRKLTLSEAIAMALENNLDIEIERTSRDMVQQTVQAARGFFDPAFRWAPLYTTNNTPIANVLQGSGGRLTDSGFAANVSMRQKLPKWGTTGRLEFSNLRQTTTNPFSTFSPFVTSQFLVGISQPLVRGFKIDRDRAELRIRERRVDIAGVDLELRAIDVVARVEQAYFDLVAAREAITVTEDAVKWAREQLALNQRLVKAGTLAPVEIAAAEAEFQRRLDTWYSSIGLLTEVENNLKSLIAPERVSSLWSDEIVPTDVDLAIAPIDDVREGVVAAVKRRPELRSLAIRKRINEIEQEAAKDAKKPEINLIGQYSLNGLAGDSNTIANPFANLNEPIYGRLNELSARNGLAPITSPPIGGAPDFLRGSYGSALSNLFGGRYQSFQVGVEIDFNLRNRTAEAQYGEALIGEKRIKLERARAEQTIEAQVRNSLQGIETARQRIAAAEASARAAKEKLDSEQRLYQTGESTNFLVLTRQNEYADSRRRTVVARLDFNRSVARLQQALGTTLSTHGITMN